MVWSAIFHRPVDSCFGLRDQGQGPQGSHHLCTRVGIGSRAKRTTGGLNIKTDLTRASRMTTWRIRVWCMDEELLGCLRLSQKGVRFWHHLLPELNMESQNVRAGRHFGLYLVQPDILHLWTQAQKDGLPKNIQLFSSGLELGSSKVS